MKSTSKSLVAQSKPRNPQGQFLPISTIKQRELFAGIPNYLYGVHRNPDRSYRDHRQDLLRMENDLDIQTALQDRKLSTGIKSWQITSDVGDEQGAQIVTVALRRTPDLTDYFSCLLEAAWDGRAGIQNAYGFEFTQEGRRAVIKRWAPVDGDSFVFGDNGDVGVKVGITDAGANVIATQEGRAEMFDSQERECWVIHNYQRSAGDFYEPMDSGRMFGYGLRARVYETWRLKQELMADLMQAAEIFGVGGLMIAYFQMSNDGSYNAVKDSMMRQLGTLKMFPRQAGQESAEGLEIISPDGQGWGDVLKLYETLGNKIRELICGPMYGSGQDKTGMGGDGVAAYADTFGKKIKYDAIVLAETITRDLVPVLAKWNGVNPDGLRFEFIDDQPAPEGEEEGGEDDGGGFDIPDDPNDLAPDEGDEFGGEDEGFSDDMLDDLDHEHLDQIHEQLEAIGFAMDDSELLKYARWITLGKDGSGTVHIQIDGKGNIVKGPKGLKAKGITHLNHFGESKGKPKAKKGAKTAPKGRGKAANKAKTKPKGKPVAKKPVKKAPPKGKQPAAKAKAAPKKAPVAKKPAPKAKGKPQAVGKDGKQWRGAPFLPLDKEPYPEDSAQAPAPKAPTEKPATNLQNWRAAMAKHSHEQLNEPQKRKGILERVKAWWDSIKKSPDPVAKEDYAPGFLGFLQRHIATSFHSEASTKEVVRYARECLKYAWDESKVERADDGRFGDKAGEHDEDEGPDDDTPGDEAEDSSDEPEEEPEAPEDDGEEFDFSEHHEGASHDEIKGLHASRQKQDEERAKAKEAREKAREAEDESENYEPDEPEAPDYEAEDDEHSARQDSEEQELYDRHESEESALQDRLDDEEISEDEHASLSNELSAKHEAERQALGVKHAQEARDLAGSREKAESEAQGKYEKDLADYNAREEAKSDETRAREDEAWEEEDADLEQARADEDEEHDSRANALEEAISEKRYDLDQQLEDGEISQAKHDRLSKALDEQEEKLEALREAISHRDYGMGSQAWNDRTRQQMAESQAAYEESQRQAAVSPVRNYDQDMANVKPETREAIHRAAAQAAIKAPPGSDMDLVVAEVMAKFFGDKHSQPSKYAWDESKHDRADDGTFGKGSGSHNEKKPEAKPAKKPLDKAGLKAAYRKASDDLTAARAELEKVKDSPAKSAKAWDKIEKLEKKLGEHSTAYMALMEAEEAPKPSQPSTPGSNEKVNNLNTERASHGLAPMSAEEEKAVGDTLEGTTFKVASGKEYKIIAGAGTLWTRDPNAAEDDVHAKHIPVYDTVGAVQLRDGKEYGPMKRINISSIKRDPRD